MSLKGAKKQKSETKSTTLNVRTCATCHRDISDEIYVKCARCSGFNQCLECFSVGIEAQNHLRTHPFILLEPFLQPIFQKGWTAEEEIILLNSIQTCGLGNWHEISDLVKTKTALECECHYFTAFIESEKAPMPEEGILPEAALPDPPDFDTAPRESRPSISHEKNLAERNKKEKTTPAEFAGWMPRRCEFEVEYLNDAEQLIAGVTFTENADNQQTLVQKLTALRIYNEQLEERHIRTHFAIDYGMLDQEFRSFGGRTKNERDMEEAMMPLAQIAPREVLTHFIHSFESQMRLEDTIETLKKWRKNGIVTRDEGVLFNQLEGLYGEDKLTATAVEKWNRDVMLFAESPEFRATLDRQLLSAAENQICRNLGLSPHSYLRIKDILLREFTIRNMMTADLAISLMPGQEKVMRTIYESLKKSGLFLTSEDIPRLPAHNKMPDDNNNENNENDDNNINNNENNDNNEDNELNNDNKDNENNDNDNDNENNDNDNDNDNDNENNDNDNNDDNNDNDNNDDNENNDNENNDNDNDNGREPQTSEADEAQRENETQSSQAEQTEQTNDELTTGDESQPADGTEDGDEQGNENRSQSDEPDEKSQTEN